MVIMKSELSKINLAPISQKANVLKLYSSLEFVVFGRAFGSYLVIPGIQTQVSHMQSICL